MVAVDWYGPYLSLTEAREKARQDYSHGLYLAIGKQKYERYPSMQYIGIATALHLRLHENHPKLSLVVNEFSLWLGEISTAEPSGKRAKVTRTTLDYAEWMHARFLQLPLNEKKKGKPPSRSVTILNRWYDKKDYYTPKQRPHKGWPDLIDFPYHELPARVVWFGKNQRTFQAPNYA